MYRGTRQADWRTRFRNSARVRGSRRKVPSMQDVIIRPPGVSMPRISRQRCRASRSGVALRPCRSGSSPSSTNSDSTSSGIESPGLGFGVAIVAHTIYGLDAIEAAQILSEIGYLLRQDPKERFRAKAFSAAAWSVTLQRPNLVDLQRAENLTSIEGVGEGIARVLADVIQTGQSRYLNRHREQFKQPARVDESDLDP